MSKKCFVICPIGEEGSETRKRSDVVLKHLLTPVLTKYEYEIVRCDKINDTDKIDATILENLDNDELVIADFSELNPNVFFELGYRTSNKKPIIHIAREDTPLPFDIKMTRSLFYDISDLDNVETFKEKLDALIVKIESDIQLSNNINAEEGGDTAKAPSVDQLTLKEIRDLQYEFSVLADHVYEMLEKIDSKVSERKDTNEPVNNQVMTNLMQIMITKAIDDPGNFLKFMDVVALMDKKKTSLNNSTQDKGDLSWQPPKSSQAEAGE